MTILDEIQTEAWYILTSIYTHQRITETLSRSSTRHDLANQLVALNALLENLVIRIARLADKRRDVRSVSMLLKRGSFSAPTEGVKCASEMFLSLAEPIIKIRHEQVAHMKLGVLSSFEPQAIPAEAIRAVEALINLIDVARETDIKYQYKIGSVEPIIDLKASLAAGTMVAVRRVEDGAALSTDANCE